MKSYKSFLSLAFVVAAALAALAPQPAWAASPSAGTAPVNKRAYVDQSGQAFMNGAADVGYKVWVSTDANPHQITDELGNVVTTGIIHQVCVSSGAAGEWAVVYDSGSATNSLTVANAATNSGGSLQLHPAVVRVTTAVTCAPVALDAQFNNGAVVLQSAVTLGASAYVYWRPSRGGAQ